MSGPLRSTPISDTFEDVAPLRHNLASHFRRAFGRDYDDCQGDLALEFMRAYETFDPEVGTFSNHLYFLGFKRLMERTRLDARRHARLPRTELDEDRTYAKPEFLLMDFLDELSDDAQRVTQLALAMPYAITAELEHRSGTPRSIRTVIKDHLVFYGWTVDRVTEAFAEVGRVLAAW